ncbi:MAG: tripartite tricarboxylate transporter TctB family protein [Desulfobacteraceae bacterium]|nr:MAG: tripartite tricarboxylate transporter TctB family protein [Desulfobacteraceae bacterium]
MNRERRKINLGEAVIPGLALVFVLAFFIQVRSAPAVALYWPVAVAAALGIFWVAVTARFVFPRSEAGDSALMRGRAGITGRVVLIFLASVGYLAAVSRLGFTLSNFFFMLLLFRKLGGRSWLRDILVAVSIAGFLHLALVVLMQLSLPRLDLGFVRI